MVDLSPADFGAYFEAIHGAPPFPWQSRLLLRVAADGRFPRLLDLPTGAGKTAAIDVALFHLALDAARPAAERTAPRRIVMVVDRRTVVDQAFARGRRIAEALGEAQGGVLKAVADRLRSLGATEAPLALAQLRGGMPRDDAWARRPDQPLLAVSTVDQVGSRLLFRGYGVSAGMRPIHAGLLGNDALLLLDEVHLSEPFRQTLEAIGRYRGWAGAALPDRWQCVEMSATPGTTGGFGLMDEDRRDGRLARRLLAKKPVHYDEVKVSGAEAQRCAAFVEACALRAADFARTGRVVGVVVNRVATARAVAAEVERRAPRGARIFLLTGRMRPVDRDALDRELSPLLCAGRAREEDAPPLVVVATQCIEAGADFDFDALVTECASLDALRQRFGRLNRTGAIDDARAAVLIRSDALGKEADPIYGDALTKTWRWLKEGEHEFGIESMRSALAGLSGEDLDALFSPKTRAPVMLPAHLDAWAQTSPVPRPDPDIALWLHGVGRRQAPEVQIVWRGDLGEGLLEAARWHEKPAVRERALEAVLARVEVCPPVGLEAIAVPLHAARAWLRGEEAPEIADVAEDARTEKAREREEERRDRERGRPALLWRGEESRVIGPGDDIEPGSTLVVPGTYGGMARSSWDPSAKDPVSDIGDGARFQQTGRPVLRLHPAVVREARWARAPAAADSDDPVQEHRDQVEAVLDEMAAEPGSRAVASLLRSRKREIVPIEPIDLPGADGAGHVEPGYLAVVGRAMGRDATTDGDDGSHTGVEVTLREHLAGVERWAARFADRCGLSPRVARSVALAAAFHDAGKVDPRFQRMLRGGGDSWMALAEPLAKSKTVAANRAARRRAQERSGYPKGTRHELSSVALLEQAPSLLGEDVDRDLVLFLIGSHHGFCRPLAPVAAPDTDPIELRFDAGGTTLRASSEHGLARLDAGVPDRFWRTLERYGWFGLAWLEALVRLADHRRSEEEQA